jgi:hypothetical protein
MLSQRGGNLQQAGCQQGGGRSYMLGGGLKITLKVYQALSQPG